MRAHGERGGLCGREGVGSKTGVAQAKGCRWWEGVAEWGWEAEVAAAWSREQGVLVFG